MLEMPAPNFVKFSHNIQLLIVGHEQAEWRTRSPYKAFSLHRTERRTAA